MALEILSDIEILSAILSIVFFVISIIIGGQILYKFGIHKRKELFSVGFTLILFSNPWWGVIFSFLSILFLGTPLTQVQFLFIADFFTPLLFMFWIYSFAELMYSNKKTVILLVFGIISAIYEVLLVYFLLTNPDVVGELELTINSSSNLFWLSYQAFALIVELITGLIIFYNSHKSEDVSVRWKGRFLLTAFILFTVGALMDAALTMNVVLLIAVRIILIVSVISFYLGFLLPKGLLNILSRGSKQE